MSGSKDFFVGIPKFLADRAFLVLAIYFVLCALYMLPSQWFEWPYKEVWEVFSFQIILFVTLCVLFVKAYRPLWGFSQKIFILFVLGFSLYLGLIFAGDQILSFVYPGASTFWPSTRWYDLVTGLLLAPVLEELFFRDYLFRSFLMEGQKRIQAILLSSLFFMLAHLSFHLGAFALGVVTACLMLRFRSIWLCILLHFGSNALITVFPYFFPHFNKAMAEMGYWNF